MAGVTGGETGCLRELRKRQAGGPGYAVKGRASRRVRSEPQSTRSMNEFGLAERGNVPERPALRLATKAAVRGYARGSHRKRASCERRL